MQRYLQTPKGYAAQRKANAKFQKKYRQTEQGKIINRLNAKKQRDEGRFNSNEYDKKRKKEDPIYRLTKNLRSRLSVAIKKGKAGSAIKDLGCTIEEFKRYLESQFKFGMTWDNYGEWHIDHIRPLASFDLSNREQFLQACHYTNLQPLWARDNLIKSNKID